MSGLNFNINQGNFDIKGSFDVNLGNFDQFDRFTQELTTSKAYQKQIYVIIDPQDSTRLLLTSNRTTAEQYGKMVNIADTINKITSRLASDPATQIKQKGTVYLRASEIFNQEVGEEISAAAAAPAAASSAPTKRKRKPEGEADDSMDKDESVMQDDIDSSAAVTNSRLIKKQKSTISPRASEIFGQKVGEEISSTAAASSAPTKRKRKPEGETDDSIEEAPAGEVDASMKEANDSMEDESAMQDDASSSAAASSSRLIKKQKATGGLGEVATSSTVAITPHEAKMRLFAKEPALKAWIESPNEETAKEFAKRIHGLCGELFPGLKEICRAFLPINSNQQGFKSIEERNSSPNSLGPDNFACIDQHGGKFDKKVVIIRNALNKEAEYSQAIQLLTTQEIIAFLTSYAEAGLFSDTHIKGLMHADRFFEDLPLPLSILTPVLEKLPSAQLAKALSVPFSVYIETSPDINNNNFLRRDQRPALFCAPIYYSRLLQKLSNFEQITLLGSRDGQGELFIFQKEIDEWLAIFSIIIDRLPLEVLFELLSKPHANVASILFKPWFFNYLAPRMQSFSSRQLLKLFCVFQTFVSESAGQDVSSCCTHKDFEATEEIIKLLDKLSSEEIVAMFEEFEANLEVRDALLKLFIDTTYNGKPLLDKLSVEQLVTLFSMQDEGGTLLHDQSCCAKAMPFLLKLSPQQFGELFAIKDADDDTPLQSYENFWLSFEEVPPDYLIEVLVNQSSPNIYLGDQETLSDTLRELDKLSTEQLMRFFTTQYSAEQGATLCHLKHMVHFLPLLKKLSAAQLMQLCVIRDQEGRTPLDFYFEPYCQAFLFLLTQKLTHEQNTLLMNTKTKDGVPLNLLTIPFSSAWITKPKQTTAKAEVSVEAYPQRAQQLSKDILALYDELNFADQNAEALNLVLFGLKKEEKEKIGEESTKARNALVYILDTITTQKIWRGTPTAAEPKERLHKWYSEMLIDFEDVARQLKQRNVPHLTAGVLLDIAATHYREIISGEGRCGTAFQSEIKQKADYLLSRGLERLEDLPVKILEFLIDELSFSMGGGNVHMSNPLAFAAGLSSIPDSYALITNDVATQKLIAHFAPDYVLPKLVSGMKVLPEGTLELWVKQQTPDTYNQDTPEAELGKAAALYEQKVMDEFTQKLQQLGLNTDQIKKFSEFVISTRVRALISSDLSSVVLEALKQGSEEDKLSIETAKIEQLLNSLKPKFAGNLDDYQKALNIFERNVKTIVSRNIMIKEIKKIMGDNKLADPLIQAKLELDGALQKWISSHEELSYNVSEFGRPSQAIEDERRSKFAQAYFDEDRTLNAEGLRLYLKKLGLI